MDYKKIAQVAMLAGKIMLESNAETYRVEETVEHILKVSQLEQTQAFAVPTGLFMTLDDASIDAISLNVRIKKRSTDLNKIHIVNDISRKLSAGALSIDDALSQLKQLRGENYTTVQHFLANIILMIAFTFMFNGTLFDGVMSFLNGIILISILYANQTFKLNLFFINALTSITMVIFTVSCVKLLPNVLSMDAILIGSIMPMVPGTIITNAIRDTFHGDYTSGMSRALEAVLVAVSIAVGVAVGFFIVRGIV